jgi:lysophospholipase L1-like esterase
MLKTVLRLVALFGLLAAGPAGAEVPWTFSNNTRYLALGDSLAAGYGAIPTTQGYAYLLYQKGTYDKTPNTIFANAAVPGATSSDVLAFQVPQAINLFQPQVVTLSVGGNDVLAILAPGSDPEQILQQFAINLGNILCGLRQALPQSRLYVHNLYDIPEITSGIPGGLQAVLTANLIIADVAMACGASVADVYSAFAGRTGLLLVERNGADQFEVHPTNAGHRAIAAAFEAVHQ